MVRCGAVSHPREWDWVGYHEIMGLRRRYRLVDLERLCWRLGTADLGQVRRQLDSVLAETMARQEFRREPIWTESLAVGSAAFVEKVKPLVLSRRETEVIQGADGMNVLRESPVRYRTENEPENRS
jgi:putative transposase